jgi:hypothetical protein
MDLSAVFHGFFMTSRAARDPLPGKGRAMRSRIHKLPVLAAGLLLWAGSARSQPLTCTEMETFLRTAKIGPQRSIPRGVTSPKRATLDDGKRKHDAGIQVVHETRTSFTTSRGTELNFKDWWQFNVAAYELAKILDLNMVPPYVERKVGGRSASVTWWINDGMLEADRLRRNLQPPDVESWNRQMYVARVFNQLIYNSDANLTNIVITPDWQLWLIDFTRAFRLSRDLENPKNLVQCDRKLLARLRELNKPLLQKRLKPYVGEVEIDGLLTRRDKIVAFFDREIAEKGEAAVLFDLPRSGQPCGVGL